MNKKKIDTFRRDKKLFMQIHVTLYLESIIIGAFDLVREIKAGFPEEVLLS